ncbi:hypothetical protein [Candidatus Uabimicrobium sp. HlEnr_7]|uniref:hypothetical protein n=1 Tax=Candidatus Uabimicrobium helgolandensis TaxID=3095367 RepID=UPI0035560A1F
MKYLPLILFLCISCQLADKKYDQEHVSEQILAYEEELKAVVSLELAMKDYKKGEASWEMCNYRIDLYMYTRKKNRKNDMQVGPPLSQRPTEEEFRRAESYLLDAIHNWKKKRS